MSHLAWYLSFASFTLSGMVGWYVPSDLDLSFLTNTWIKYQPRALASSFMRPLLVISVSHKNTFRALCSSGVGGHFSRDTNLDSKGMIRILSHVASTASFKHGSSLQIHNILNMGVKSLLSAPF